MRRLPAERIREMWGLLTSRLHRRTAELADTFFPMLAGKVLPGQIMHALAARAGPASDYTHPPQSPHQAFDDDGTPNPYDQHEAALAAGTVKPCADYCRKHGCPCADNCAGEPCYLLQT